MIKTGGTTENTRLWAVRRKLKCCNVTEYLVHIGTQSLNDVRARYICEGSIDGVRRGTTMIDEYEKGRQGMDVDESNGSGDDAIVRGGYAPCSEFTPTPSKSIPTKEVDSITQPHRWPSSSSIGHPINREQ